VPRPPPRTGSATSLTAVTGAMCSAILRATSATTQRPRGSPARAAPIPFSYVGRMFVVGRGLEFATAREIALKLSETCQIAVEPLTATALAHGPVAVLDSLFPVWTIASRDKALPAVIDAAQKCARRAGRWS
jgi:glucosamine 6-phosphate synthetase-like amidotransferase/phosphosugar isomerase protein